MVYVSTTKERGNMQENQAPAQPAVEWHPHPPPAETMWNKESTNQPTDLWENKQSLS